MEKIMETAPSGLEVKEIRALRLLSKGPAHDAEDQPIAALDKLIQSGFAQIADRYYASWGGCQHVCREVRITEAGLRQVSAA